MKKIILLSLLGVLYAFAFSSCEEEGFENMNEDTYLALVHTRSNYNTGNVPDIIDQINDVPVNIMIVGTNAKKNYLSVQKRGSLVDLYSKDDGSMRQRFLIKNTSGYAWNIHLLGGNNSYTDPTVMPIMNNNKVYPILGSKITGITGISNNVGTVRFYKTTANPRYYHIRSTGLGYDKSLQPESHGSSTLIFSNNTNYNQTDVWDVKLLKGSELLRLRYIMEDDDYIDTTFVLGKTYVEDNLMSETPKTTSFELEEIIKTTSSFNHNYGMSIGITNSATIKVGIPDINTDLTVSSGYTTNNTWGFSFNNTEEKSVKYTSKHGFTIPPKKRARITVMIRDYIGQVTYIAQIRDRHTGKILYIKGKWNGKIGDELFLKTEYLNSATRSTEKGEPFDIEGAKMYHHLFR